MVVGGSRSVVVTELRVNGARPKKMIGYATYATMPADFDDPDWLPRGGGETRYIHIICM